MRKNTIITLAGSLVLCVVGVSTWATSAFSKPTYVLNSTAPLALTQLQKYYGISFTASPTDASKEPITAQQAVAVVNNMFVKPIAMSATFGYMTINPNGNAVFIPPTTKAGQANHGVVRNYPVWLVRQSNVMMYPGGGAMNPKATKAERERYLKAKQPHKGSNYTFIDATNGQRFFTVTVSN